MPHRWKPNVTVAAVIERDGRFLLVEEDTSDGIRLNNPAGHLDPGESPIQACVREVLEETAFDFKPSALLGIYMNRFVRRKSGADTTYMRFAFTGTVGAFYENQPLDEGIRRTVWMTADEMRAEAHQMRSPLVLQSLDDYLAGQRFALNLIYTDVSVLVQPDGVRPLE